MPFDFNQEPCRIFSLWPQTPFPVEISIYGYCQVACDFCFSNRNRDAADRELHDKNSAPALFRKLSRAMNDPLDPIGFFLRERYPVCFSNTTDPWQRAEKTHRATLAFLKWSVAERVPVYFQTRGNVLLDDWETYAPYLTPGLHVVYLSICQMDDAVRRRHEPGAQALEKRWALARRLSDHGIPVIAACNPYLREWVPDPAAYCDLAAKAGVRGIWLEALHFTPAQADTLPSTGREILPKANLLPMFLIGQLKQWREACAARDLDFFPTPRWDAYFGHRARHPECADPAWLGGNALDFNFQLLKAVSDLSREHGGAKVCFSWAEIRDCLEALEVPNPTLKTGPFWTAFNNKVNADYAAWRARLGSTAVLYEIIRYFFNQPWECQNFVWYHPLVQGLFDRDANVYVGDQDGDKVAVFNPAIKHHGERFIDQSEVDQAKVLWADFKAPVEV